MVQAARCVATFQAICLGRIHCFGKHWSGKELGTDRHRACKSKGLVATCRHSFQGWGGGSKSNGQSVASSFASCWDLWTSPTITDFTTSDLRRNICWSWGCSKTGCFCNCGSGKLTSQNPYSTRIILYQYLPNAKKSALANLSLHAMLRALDCSSGQRDWLCQGGYWWKALSSWLLDAACHCVNSTGNLWQDVTSSFGSFSVFEVS